jgi:hypothetical protein
MQEEAPYSFRERLNAARGAPLLQVAVDGWWERAIGLWLPTTTREAAGLLLTAGARELGVEVLWPGPPIVFVGACFAASDRPPVCEIAMRHEWTPTQALKILVGDSLGAPLRAELGAINAWRSVGPLPLALDAVAAAIESKLLERADLMFCGHPVALEVQFESPRRAWCAIEVSARHGDKHVVDVDEVAGLLRSVSRTRITDT